MSYANMDTDFRRPYRGDAAEEPVLPLVRRRQAFDPEEPSPWSARERVAFDHDYLESLLAEEERIDADWRRRRPRRIAVRILGWTALAGLIWGAVLMTAFGPARRAIVEWGTLGSNEAAALLR